jgi:predicted DCC family thiol-disulfide oxidoreductase YuxK
VADPAPVWVLYDEDCGFCRWSADRIKRWDRRGGLAFASIQSRDGQDLLRACPLKDRLDTMHAVTRDGRVWSGGEAVRVISGVLPGALPVRAFATAFPDATERLYRLVARHRQTFGRWLGQAACSVDPSRTTSG